MNVLQSILTVLVILNSTHWDNTVTTTSTTAFQLLLPLTTRSRSTSKSYYLKQPNPDVVISFLQHQRLFTLPVTRYPHQEKEEKEKEHYHEHNNRSYKSKRKDFTLADLRKELLKNPTAAVLGTTGTSPIKKKKKRTRRRAENPQQTYVYAAQRRKNNSKVDDDDIDDHDQEENDGSSSSDTSSNAATAATKKFSSRYIILTEAKRMGLINPAVTSQHCYPLVDDRQPEIIGQLRVGEEEVTKSETFAYIINKPQGWSILGGSGSNSSSNSVTPSSKDVVNKRNKSIIQDTTSGREENLQCDNADEDVVVEAANTAFLMPEQRTEMAVNDAGSNIILNPTEDVVDDPVDFKNSIPGWYHIENMTPEQREEAGIEADDYDPSDILDFDEADLLDLLSPGELVDYYADKNLQNNQNSFSTNQTILERFQDFSEEDLDPIVVENLKRIRARITQGRDVATFSSFQRPSVVSWLKEKKMQEGIPIRGGNFWTAFAGASEVDDSGLVLLVPKKNSNNIFVDFTEYITVVGNGNNIDAKATKDIEKKHIPKEAINTEIISKLKRNREGDVTTTVRLVISELPSTCSSIIGHVQTQFDDGIRGDPVGNPFDRRASRRLIHCQSISVSSLLVDQTVQAESELPDDITILSNRLNNHNFRRGSFLGRQALQENPHTNAYREINGAADGFPGWTVDRYGQWLLVQHDEKECKGPLPSIHDGYTAGVYLLPSSPNRGAMGSKDNIRPYLLEGRPAPDTIEILENGIKYQVSLYRDLSTGIFLDQRPNRAWLAQNCNNQTHVLNCFAHCGAFAVAAATAGASTVSIDLNKKWLDRIQPQLEANGVKSDERHDYIYGDCFDWLEKLAKRGEKFDIVILDPPSSSVGKKKKRWSVKNDMDELVQIAAPLVKKGGLLWTITNSASIPPLKFANQCWKGLQDAGIKQAKLERIQPMSVDFPSIGSQPVKNLVWKIN
jgi:23S rRNA G2069 N7-methylase RlmK/C1962 C5-methylase RlmI